MGIHMALCHGPVDYVQKIYVDGRLAWSGNSTGGSIYVDAEDLFGGEKKEGGVSGTVDLEFGESTQGINSYLSGQLGADTPAFRGVMCAVLNQCYLGNNPYLKPWSFELSRIHVIEDGTMQWYDAKAEIPRDVDTFPLTSIIAVDDYFDALILTLPDSTDYSQSVAVWPSYQGPFGNAAHPYPHADYPAPTTYVPSGSDLHKIWLRKSFTLSGLAPVDIQIKGDNYTRAWWNGVEVSLSGGGFPNFISVATINPTITNNTLMVSVEDTPADIPANNYVYAGVIADLRSGSSTSYDMNPAHIIREALTQSWGLGYPESDIDDDSFIAAADTLYDELMGISILWDKEIPLEDFISQITQHINAVLYVSRTTGKFVLKLIRDDYTVGSLLVLDETNAQMAKNASRPTIGELVTSITVQFTDTGAEDEPGSVIVHNEALIQMQGVDRGATVQYPGFTNRSIATRVALRDLKALSTPLLSAEVTANREAAALNIGDVFVLNFPEQGINSLVMRVQSVSVGDGLDNSVSIGCVEDAFSAPPVSVVTDDTIRWTDPLTIPAEAADPRLIIETPYYELVQSQGQLSVDAALADDPDLGYMAATAGRQGGELNANLLVDSGAGYVDSAVLDFAAYATLSIDAWYSDANLYYTSGKDLDVPVSGDLAQIGDEIIRFDALGTDSNGTFMTVGRGVLDTTPAEHTAGASIVFFDLASDEVRYTASDSVDVKIQTTTGSSTSSSEPVDTVIMDSRAIRPYAPGDLKIDGFSYDPSAVYDDEAVLTWKHRDRLQQTSGVIFDYTDTNIGPEAGTTYIVRAGLIDSLGVEVDFVDENVGNVLTYTHAFSDGTFTPSPIERQVRWRVYAIRGGYESWQPAQQTIIAPAVFIDSNSMPWSPADITTALWLDASDDASLTYSGTVLESWNDKSGNSRDASQSTSGFRPATGTQTINGLNVIDFDGVDDGLLFSGATLNGLTQATIYYVLRVDNDPAATANSAGFHTLTGTNSMSVHSHYPYSDGIIYDAFGSTVRKTVGNQTKSLASTRIYAAHSRTNSWEAWLDGTSIYSTGTNTFDIDGSNRLGMSLNASGAVGHFYKGIFAEIIVTEGSGAPADREIIEGYLAHKWGLAANLPGSHPYKNYRPTVQST
jgi:hypothetical protein